MLCKRYRIEKVLGQGGFATVYQAFDLSLNRLVAIKHIQEFSLSDQSEIQRLRRESSLLSKLEHVNIVGVYALELLESEGMILIIMELVDGEPLNRLIARDFLLFNPARCRAILAQLCQALSYAHGQSIVHRDLSSANVIVCDWPDQPKVKLIDFGLSKLLRPASSDSLEQPSVSLTKTGVLLGNPNYMSPEACRGEKLDALSDLYSLGCVGYEMLNARLLFPNTEPIGLLFRQQNEYPPVPRLKWDRSDKSCILGAILYCLQKKKDKRPSSALHVLEVLEGREQLPSNLDFPFDWQQELRAVNVVTAFQATIAVLLSTLIILSLTLLSRKGPVPLSSHSPLPNKKLDSLATRIESSKQLLEKKEELYGKNHVKLVPVLRKLYKLELQQANIAGARKIMLRALEISEQSSESALELECLEDLCCDPLQIDARERESYAKRAINLLSKLGKEEFIDPHSKFLRELARSLVDQGKLAEAQNCFCRRVELFGKPSNYDLEANNDLAAFYRDSGQMQKALLAYEKALKSIRQAAIRFNAADSASSELESLIGRAEVQGILGLNAQSEDSWKEATSFLNSFAPRRAQVSLAEMEAAPRMSTYYQLRIADGYSKLLLREGRKNDAKEVLNNILESSFIEQDPERRIPLLVLLGKIEIGEPKDRSSALRHFDEALALSRLPQVSLLTRGRLINDLFIVFSTEGEPGRARSCLKEGEVLPTNPYTASILLDLAAVDCDSGGYAEARERIYRVLEMKNVEPVLLSQAKRSLARLNEKLGNYLEAEKLYKESLSLLEKYGAQRNIAELCAVLSGLADLYRIHMSDSPGALEAADKILSRGIGLGKIINGEKNTYYADMLVRRASVLVRIGKNPKEAERLLLEARSIDMSSAGGHKDLIAVFRELAECYRFRTKTADAERVLLQIKELEKGHQ